ncbi:hypothetical protein M422DRAFT_268071 [Sphaerobolus stellatus SS14]|uniref:Uncharacterized protein n=1 Tax=Sphaerobolus stellatus (strain SS14) TaxID=990650 RepID=A0A0C9TKX1_SPHS4|nr:hypothetical protein M422DRAFT_268071 [Sphaerobolus stellatus SS14]
MTSSPRSASASGSAIISSIASIFSVDQLSTSHTYQVICATAEFPIGRDVEGVLSTITAVLFYHPQPDDPPMKEGYCYYIFGKIATVHPTTELPEDIERSVLDFQVDVWSISKLEGKQRPIPPFISVTGSASNKKARSFDLHNMQYFHTGESRSSFSFTFPENSRKYRNNLPIPSPNSVCHVTGILTRSTVKNSAGIGFTQADVADISFPGVKRNTIGGSLLKGQQSTTASNWLTDDPFADKDVAPSSHKRALSPVDLTKDDEGHSTPTPVQKKQKGSGDQGHVNDVINQSYQVEGATE